LYLYADLGSNPPPLTHSLMYAAAREPDASLEAKLVYKVEDNLDEEKCL